ncbi:MAG: hypothetical protein HOV68_01055 [Streptomycetaceae bacterium]|nr:hypothetical protein [Streptomycetaceae bacterium]
MASHRKPSCPHTERPCPQCQGRRRRKYRAWSAAFLLGAVVTAAFAAWNGQRLHRHLDEIRPYDNAAPCPPGEPRPWDCIGEVQATVVYIVDVDSKNQQRHSIAVRSDAFPTTKSIEVSDSGPLIDTVHKGDPITLTIWRDRVIALRAADKTEKTHDTPRDNASQAITLLGILITATALLMRFGIWLARNLAQIADITLIPALDNWKPTDIALTAAVAMSIAAGAATPLINPGRSPATQTLLTAASIGIGLIAGRAIAPMVIARLKPESHR